MIILKCYNQLIHSNRLQKLLSKNYYLFALHKSKFSTNEINANNNKNTTIKSNNTIWKSSKLNENQTERIRLKQNELLKSLDQDFSHIKEELLLFEIKNQGTYRGYFIVIIANFILWTVCAQILHKFYSFMGQNKAVIERQIKYENEKHDMKYFDRISEYFKVYGYSGVTRAAFFLIGLGSTALFFYLLTHCVAYIKLMPGGKQIKVGLVSWNGGIQPEKNARIFNLKDITTTEHRLDNCYYITMKLRNQKSSYLIDRQGHFPEETIYDLTLGLKRRF